MSGGDRELDEVAGAADRPTYNTAAVEQQTGLRPATFRAWERRYGFPKPSRLPGNQRLYSDQDIAAIRWLQRRTDEGLAISNAIQLLRDRLADPRPATRPASGRPTAAMAEELERVLTDFDSAAAEVLAAEAFGLYAVEQVCLEVIQPALVQIGERWHRGELSVAAEHFASAFVRRKLFALLNAYESSRGRGLVFTACAPEEWHEVGILMVSLFLVRRGLRVSYLGPSLTADGLAETLQHQQPDVLCISATNPDAAERMDDIVRVVESLPEPRPLLAFGGQAFADPARRSETRGVYLGPDARAAVTTVEELVASRQ